jgi:hypothetical protein
VKKIFLALVLIGCLGVGVEVVRNALFLFSANSPDPAYKIVLVEPGPDLLEKPPRCFLKKV